MENILEVRNVGDYIRYLGGKCRYNLGLDYPQHFSRMFKRREGITPSEYLAAIKRR